MALIIILIKCRFVSRETTLTKYSLHSLKKFVPVVLRVFTNQFVLSGPPLV
jgi:hypothetical protein